MSDPTPSRPEAVEPFDLLVEAAEIVSRHTLNLDNLLERLVGLVSRVVDSELIAIMLKMTSTMIIKTEYLLLKRTMWRNTFTYLSEPH